MPRCPAPLHLAAALAAALAVSACGGETPAAATDTDWIVDAGADTSGVAAALGVFGTDAVDQAFERLAARPYRVTVTVVELDPEGDLYDADTLGVFERTLAVAPGAAPRVTATRARGSLSDSTGLDAAHALPSNPFSELLPDDVPFLDRRTRGAYRVGIVQTNLGPQRVAEVADADAARPLVRSAVVWDRVVGQRALSVTRVSTSAIYDETSTATLEFGQGRGADLPERVTTYIETATPLQRRRLVTTWHIQPLGDAPPTTNTREP